MRFVEYRILLPLSVEEFEIAQLYSIARLSCDMSGKKEGVEILVNEPFEDERGKGTYTHKIYHIESYFPGIVRAMLPADAMKLDEKAWNLYPYCKTVLTCPYLGDKALIEIESIHANDSGGQPNIFSLNDKHLKKRRVDWVDIVKDSVDKKMHKRNEDPSLVASAKTGRGPLKPGWAKQGSLPVMCAYKLVKTRFKYFGKAKVCEYIAGMQRSLFLLNMRQSVCWMDEWISMTMDDIRRYEDEVKEATDRALGRSQGTTRARSHSANPSTRNNHSPPPTHSTPFSQPTSPVPGAAPAPNGHLHPDHSSLPPSSRSSSTAFRAHAARGSGVASTAATAGRTAHRSEHHHRGTHEKQAAVAAAPTTTPTAAAAAAAGEATPTTPSSSPPNGRSQHKHHQRAAAATPRASDEAGYAAQPASAPSVSRPPLRAPQIPPLTDAATDTPTPNSRASHTPRASAPSALTAFVPLLPLPSCAQPDLDGEATKRKGYPRPRGEPPRVSDEQAKPNRPRKPKTPLHERVSLASPRTSTNDDVSAEKPPRSRSNNASSAFKSPKQAFAGTRLLESTSRSLASSPPRVSTSDINEWLAAMSALEIAPASNEEASIPDGSVSLFFFDVSVQAVACGASHSVALSDKGRIYQWGLNPTSRKAVSLPLSVPFTYTVTQVACGGSHTLVLTESGTVWSWGCECSALGRTAGYSPLIPDRVEGLEPHIVTYIACGHSHSAAVAASGRVFCWGQNGEGQLGLGQDPGQDPGQGLGQSHECCLPTAAPVPHSHSDAAVRVACGMYHTAVVTKKGSLYTAGKNTHGQLGYATDDDNSYCFRQVLGVATDVIVQAACGGFHTLALANDGTVLVWRRSCSGGANDFAGDQVHVLDIPFSSRVVDIQCGAMHSLLLTANGELWVWGDGSSGQLGSGSDKKSPAPKKAPLLRGLRAIACGGHHSLAVGENGNVYACGLGHQGQLGLGNSISSPIFTILDRWIHP